MNVGCILIDYNRSQEAANPSRVRIEDFFKKLEVFFLGRAGGEKNKNNYYCSI